MRPLLTDDEYNHTASVVADFQREGGEGEALQTYLEEKASSERNWMEEWWEQLAYLRTRTTMAIYINWFGVFPAWGFEIDPLSAAALLLEGMLSMRSKIEAGAFGVEKMRGAPLDMHQFTRVFGMTRVPAEGADELVQEPDSQHIALMRDGAIVTVNVYDGGRPLPFAKLRAALGAALSLADAKSSLEDQETEGGAASKDGTLKGTHLNTSLLTALNRDTWAKERQGLLADPTSAESLKAVESAICCMSFERASPKSKEEVATLCHGGSCRNLWFDKSVTMLVFENGAVGINAEHTPVDAMTIVSLIINSLEELKGKISDPSQRSKLLSSTDAAIPRGVPPPKLLKWTLPLSARAALEQASTEVVTLASDCEIVHLPFLHFGKGLVKRLKLHPDFFMQMALQLTMYRMHKIFCATYETGHTRAFFHGRTDTVRTLSNESVEFVKTMEDSTKSNEEKMASLKAACNAHSEQVQRVLTGQGIDRHLLGLYIAAYLKGVEPFPAIFSDKAYKLSGGGGNYRLSTSNVGYTPLFGGFAPMTADGYGCCYSMLEGRMNIMITTWHSCKETSAKLFRDTLVKTLIEMRGLGAASGSSKL